MHVTMASPSIRIPLAFHSYFLRVTVGNKAIVRPYFVVTPWSKHALSWSEIALHLIRKSRTLQFSCLDGRHYGMRRTAPVTRPARPTIKRRLPMAKGSSAGLTKCKFLTSVPWWPLFYSILYVFRLFLCPTCMNLAPLLSYAKSLFVVVVNSILCVFMHVRGAQGALGNQRHHLMTNMGPTHV